MDGPVYPLKNRSLDHLGPVGRLMAERMDAAEEKLKDIWRPQIQSWYEKGTNDGFRGGLASLIEPSVGGIDRRPPKWWR